VAGIGLLAALAFLGAGIGIGFAVSGNDHRDRPHVMIMPGRAFGYDPGTGYGPRGHVGMWPLPGGPYGNGGSASAVPSPAPSTTG
jgi:hypothetical protein